MFVANKLAKQIGQGEFLGLVGDLGVGKTVFARGFIRSLTTECQEVLSPTFSLVQTYQIYAGCLTHFDLYRVKSSEEIHELGFDEALINGVVLVEWPCRLGILLPEDRIEVKIGQGKSENSRKIELSGFGYWRSKVIKLVINGSISGSK